jgi:hypothetical protein
MANQTPKMRQKRWLWLGSLTHWPNQLEIRIGDRAAIHILLFCHVLPGEWLFISWWTKCSYRYLGLGGPFNPRWH